MSEHTSLHSFRALSFDCYGTLVDWETGILNALEPLTNRLDKTHPFRHDPVALLKQYSFYEGKFQTAFPKLRYASILENVYEELAIECDLEGAIDNEEKIAFGVSIGTWPVFPDTVQALLDMKKSYKIIVLSNVDRESFARTLSGPLAGVDFDAIYLAEEIGSYKPDARNFNFLKERCQIDLGVRPEELLHTAYALIHDLVPAMKAGLSTCWIERKPNAMGGELAEVDIAKLTFQFKQLIDMADAV